VAVGVATDRLAFIDGTASSKDEIADFATGMAGTGLVATSGQLSVNAAAIATGILSVTHGGTGTSSLANDSVLTANGASAIVAETNLTCDGTTLTVTGAMVAGVSYTVGDPGGTAGTGLIRSSVSHLATTTNALFTSISTPGASMTNGDYTPTFATSGSGTGATFHVNVQGASIASIRVTGYGTGYAVSDTITIDAGFQRYSGGCMGRWKLWKFTIHILYC
jgi:hypothetical protein